MDEEMEESPLDPLSHCSAVPLVVICIHFNLPALCTLLIVSFLFCSCFVLGSRKIWKNNITWMYPVWTLNWYIWQTVRTSEKSVLCILEPTGNILNQVPWRDPAKADHPIPLPGVVRSKHTCTSLDYDYPGVLSISEFYSSMDDCLKFSVN